MTLLEVISGVLKLLSYILSFFKARRTAENHFGLKLLKIGELEAVLSSPLKRLPPYIQRPCSISSFGSNKMIIAGGPGVGKTREAYELIKYYSHVLGAEYVYYGTGYVELPSQIPEDFPVRRVMVFIDDYDYRLISTASKDYYEREAAIVSSMSNLRRLLDFFEKRTELCCFVVTVNSTRLPLSSENASAIGNFMFTKLTAVEQETYSAYLDKLISMFNLQTTDEVRNRLLSHSDGRFDTLSIFVANIDGDTLDDRQVEKFVESRDERWKLFKRSLSSDQEAVYDLLQVLQALQITPRIDYVIAALKLRGAHYSKNQVTEICSQIWRIGADVIITYAGQFQDRLPDSSQVSMVAYVLREVGNKLRVTKRYEFLTDCKDFVFSLAKAERQDEAVHLLRRLILWYKRDQLVHLWLSSYYGSRRKFLIASLLLYHALRDSDPFIIYYGKSVRIQLHLLLARIYEQWKPYLTEWNKHYYVETEYKRAIMFADIELRDAKPDDFEIVFHKYPSDKDAVQAIRNYITELGLDAKKSTEIEDKALRAMAHHRYAGCLAQQTHREHDALSEEMKALEYMEFGEGYLSCAMLFMRLTNFQASLAFLKKAETAKPSYLTLDVYNYMLLRNKTAALIAMGSEEDAKQTYNAAVDIIMTSTSIDDEWRLRFESEISELSPENPEWRSGLELARQRRISFEGDRMVYRDLMWNLALFLPADWKVVGERRDVAHAYTVFSSQVKWDDFRKIPHNASISVGLDNERGNQEKKIPEYFEVFTKSFTPKLKGVWKRDESTVEQIGEAMQWSFLSTGKYGKAGRLIIIKKSNLFAVFHMMCESESRKIFFPIFDLFTSDALNQFKH